MRAVLCALAVWLASVSPAGQPSRHMLCAAAWKAADANGDGVLVDREATPYLAMMYLHKAAVPPDGRIDRDHFVDACLAGIFRTGYIAD
ncbi:MAG: hypothetical protein FJX20_14820 [Alphaproteobacteria bacterium]|nr:hypothetical protein [Alphaproteobacteria bacterium]